MLQIKTKKNQQQQTPSKAKSKENRISLVPIELAIAFLSSLFT
jgi:hypothetical protein